MQASSAFAVGLSRCCSRTFLHSARGASRIRAACRPRRVASTATASASGAGDADSSSTGAAATTSPSPAPKGNRDLRDALSELRDVLLDPNKLVRAVAGGKSKGADPRWRKLEMRPVALKRGGIKLQVVKYDERQAFTSNHAYANGRVTKERGKEVLTASAAAEEALAIPFKTWRVETADEVLNLQVSKSGGATVKRTRQLLSNASKGSKNTAPGGAAGGGPAAHDKVKPRLLSPSDPFLIRVGVSKEDGSDVKHAKRDKYKQVEEFLRLLDVATADARTGQHLRVSTVGDPLRLVDLGCGNAYLTFGAYAHMAVNKKEAMRVVGVDVKRQARETNARVASELGWDDACRFVEGTIRDAVVAFDAGERRSSGGAVEGADGTGDVEDDVAKPEVDIVLALHACDVATDEAIARAVRWNAPLTLVSPCCHHDLQVRLRDAKMQPFPPLSRHGILRERLGDIITDAFRAHVLRLLGHRVSVEEWIGGEHTARNVMIKAVRTGVGADRATWEEYDDMCAQWGVTPRLAEMLEGELAAARAEAFRE